MKRWIPLLIILALMALAYLFDVAQYFTFEEMQQHRDRVIGFVRDYPFHSPLAFILLYLISTALSLPIGIYISIFGGFLFPQPWCTIYVVIGATLGASLIFWAARTALRDFFKKRVGKYVVKMEAGFEENPANYLLFLRLLPIFPFWIVNIVPALTGVRFFTYFWTTVVGITPGAFVFTQFGTGLGSILEKGGELNVNKILTTDVKIALVALALFVMIPVIYKKFFRKNR